MAALVNSRTRRSPFLDLFAVELAPREGRVLAVVQIATACAITVAIAMVFRIPEPTYMAYIVFLVSKDEKGATVTTAVGGQLAVTLAVILTLGLMAIDLSEPALRLPLMALVTFVAMYTARTFVLGPITYLAGFVIVLVQSAVDSIPSPEILTRLTLWLWVVLFIPVVVTVLLNLLFGQSARQLTERTLRKVLSEMEAALLWGNVPEHLSHWREVTLGLLGKHPSRVAAIHRLADVLVILEALPVDATVAERRLVAKEVTGCRHALKDDSAARSRETSAHAEDPRGATLASDAPTSAAVNSSSPALVTGSPAVLALDATLRALHEAIAQPTEPKAPSEPHARRRPFTADALTNAAHWQFALKTTLAVMLVYAIYTLLDWPGMRTSITTCFFVALGSLGETVHKLTLRISGALIGGSIAGLCIVFVLPHMTDIGQLCLLIAVVAAGAGWIATSSERLAYAGMQIAFAFFLGVLQDYAPATDLTVLRDRVAGILLGNVVMTLVFSLLWQESATSYLQAALAEVLRAIGAVLKGGGDTAAARLRTAQALVKADHFQELRAFELSILPKHRDVPTPAPGLPAVDRLAGAALVATAGPLVSFQDSASLAAAAQWADAAAESTEDTRALPPAPLAAPASGAAAGARPLPSADLGVPAESAATRSAPAAPLAATAHRATEDLLIEIGNVVTTTP